MKLLILGASARAAAHSALRAGITPTTIDLFADRDLASVADASKVESRGYPATFLPLVLPSSDDPWMYTGALENHPDLIDEIASRRLLWGIGGDSLRAVRDPIAVADTLHRNGLPSIPVCRDPSPLPRDGSWLVKPINSAGGRRIHPLREDFVLPTWPSYFQKRMGGTDSSYAAIFVGDGQRCTLAGVTLQKIGRPDAPFAYRGSIGPVLPPPDPIERIGRVLTREFGLRGLFGVDFVVADGVVHVVEVNPRYTASVEILEMVSCRPLLAEHGRIFDRRVHPHARSRRQPPAFAGKEILFADERCRVPRIDAWIPRGKGIAVSPLADIPEPGLAFEAGDPILTVKARGSSQTACEARLQTRLDRWRQRIVPQID